MNDDAGHRQGSNLLLTDGHAGYRKRSALADAKSGGSPKLNPGKPTTLLAADAKNDSEVTTRLNIDRYTSAF